MARLASEAKGGFYATPPDEMELVCNRRLQVKPGSKVNLLDPCCGEGAALEQIAGALRNQGATVRTFGVELEEDRAKAAKRILTRAVYDGYEYLQASHGAFSALWLNPPYNEQNGRRVEVRFLSDLTWTGGYLQPGGLLMYCIPQYVLEPAASVLASRFENIRVYRFTDRNFPVYHQIVLFGYRRTKKAELEEVRAEKQRIIDLSRGELPPLTVEDGVIYNIPPARREVILFRGRRLDIDEIKEVIEHSPVWTVVEDALFSPSARASAVLKPPVMPLKPAHYAVAIAAGAVGGNMGDHILVGHTKKVTDKKQISGEEKTTVVETDRHITTVRIFSPEGIFMLQ